MSKEDLQEKYSYQIETWINTLGSYPVEEIEHADYSEAYEMARGHVFELENGEYATIIEEGCSCYAPCDAQIELHPSEDKAVKKFEEWESNQGGLF